MPKVPKKGARLNCLVTGKTKYISEVYLKKKLSKFGSLEGFRAHYISNEAKRYLKKGMKVPEVRAHLECGEELPDVDLTILARLKLLKKEKKNKKRQPKIFSEEEIEKVQKTKAEKQQEFEKEVASYGPVGAWVREMSGVPNGGVCLRPDIYLNNDEYCDGCEHYEHCMCRIWNHRKKQHNDE